MRMTRLAALVATVHSRWRGEKSQRRRRDWAKSARATRGNPVASTTSKMTASSSIPKGGRCPWLRVRARGRLGHQPSRGGIGEEPSGESVSDGRRGWGARNFATMELKLKRAYNPPSKDDGCRILVDRLWPRGLRKNQARIDCWLKEIAPSTALRKWFGHDPTRWDEFRRRYFAELDGRTPVVEELRKRTRQGSVTLIYGARDGTYNHAVALQEYLRRRA
jgi:uncharacterized protein YeaO (DUF488 family)